MGLGEDKNVELTKLLTASDAACKKLQEEVAK